MSLFFTEPRLPGGRCQNDELETRISLLVRRVSHLGPPSENEPTRLGVGSRARARGNKPVLEGWGLADRPPATSHSTNITRIPAKIKLPITKVRGSNYP